MTYITNISNANLAKLANSQPLHALSPKEIDCKRSELEAQGFDVVVMEKLSPTKRVYICPDCGSTYEYAPRVCSFCGIDLL